MLLENQNDLKFRTLEKEFEELRGKAGKDSAEGRYRIKSRNKRGEELSNRGIVREFISYMEKMQRDDYE